MSDDKVAFATFFSFSVDFSFLGVSTLGSVDEALLERVIIEDADEDDAHSGCCFLAALVGGGLAVDDDRVFAGGALAGVPDDGFSSFTGRGTHVMKGFGADFIVFKHCPDSFRVVWIALKWAGKEKITRHQ